MTDFTAEELQAGLGQLVNTGIRCAECCNQLDPCDTAYVNEDNEQVCYYCLEATDEQA